MPSRGSCVLRAWVSISGEGPHGRSPWRRTIYQGADTPPWRRDGHAGPVWLPRRGVAVVPGHGAPADLRELWPQLEDYDVDLNTARGPKWLDDAGRAARERLRSSDDAVVIGHGDFYADNLRWHGDELVVVHDWDSVVADSEAALVGFTAAVYPTLHAGDEATVKESAAFLTAYQRASRSQFTRDQIQRSWAAGVWLRAFDAKKQSAVGQPVRSLDERVARQRLANAGTFIA